MAHSTRPHFGTIAATATATLPPRQPYYHHTAAAATAPHTTRSPYTLHSPQEEAVDKETATDESFIALEDIVPDPDPRLPIELSEVSSHLTVRSHLNGWCGEVESGADMEAHLNRARSASAAGAPTVGGWVAL